MVGVRSVDFAVAAAVGDDGMLFAGEARVARVDTDGAGERKGDGVAEVVAAVAVGRASWKG